jgi:hypothetical protein
MLGPAGLAGSREQGAGSGGNSRTLLPAARSPG